MKEKSASLLVLLALLFLLAFSIRVMSFERHTLPWADPWLHYSMTQTFSETHHYTPWNNMANFPQTGKNWTPPGFYSVLLLPFTVMSDNAEHLIFFFEVWPILFGASAVVLMYVLMKTAFNKRIGFLSGFFFAIVSAASIRSTSGVYRGDVFLVTILLLALYCYLKIYTTPILKGSVWIILEILLLTTVMLLFNGWILILLILLSFSFLMSIVNITKRISHFKNSFIAASVTIPAVVYFLCFNTLHDNLMPDFVVTISAALVVILGVLVYTDICGRLFVSKEYPFLAIFLIVPLVVLWIFRESLPELQKFLISRSAFFLPQTEVSRQILELQPVTPSAYISAFTSLILMVVFGGILLLFSIIKGKKKFSPRKPKVISICLLGVWVAVSVYMSVTLNRFLFTAAPGICAFSGMAFYYFFYSAEQSIRSPMVRLLTTYSVIFLYVLVPMFGSFYIYSDTDTYMTPQWEEASSWLYNNSGADASILTEWDQSNWFQAISHRCTATDTIMAQIPQKSANFFCVPPQKAVTYVKYKRIQYVALDKRTLGRYYVMLSFAKDPVTYEESAAYALYFGEVPGMDLVFEYDDVKMFAVVYDTALVTNFSYTISDDTVLITLFTYNPDNHPVELMCTVTIRNMESEDIFSQNITITAYPGTTQHETAVAMPLLYRFFIVLEEGTRAPLVRAVFIK